MPQTLENWVDGGCGCAYCVEKRRVRDRLRATSHERLIHTAPEMLAKLEEVERVITDWPRLHESGDYLHGWILNSIRELIAKAKGESA